MRDELQGDAHGRSHNDASHTATQPPHNAASAPLNTGGKEIRSLTGLRGLAAVFVVIFHEAGNFGGNGPGATFLRHGYNAVDLFFVLSGFVMALTYGDSFKDGFSSSEHMRFLEKRIARVYPLYILATIITFGVFSAHLSHLEQVSNPWPTLIENIFMVQSWGLSQGIVGPAWSISTEWGAYIVFPALALLALSKTAWKPAVLFSLAVAGLLFLEFGSLRFILGDQQNRLGPLDLYGKDTLAPLVRCLCSFSLGLIAFRFRHFAKPSWSLPLFVGTLATLAFPGTDLLFVLLCSALVPSLATDEGPIAASLGSAPVFSLGVWSYSIYILHARFNPVRSTAEKFLLHIHCPTAAAPAGAIVMSLSVLILCAAVTYRLIEKPGRNALRQAFQLRRDSPTRTEPAL